MKTITFTFKQLVKILEELAAIDDPLVFENRVFGIIHLEIMKASFSSVKHNCESTNVHNILLEDLAAAKKISKSKLQSFCNSLQDNGEIAIKVMHTVNEIKSAIAAIDEEDKNLSYWKVADIETRFAHWQNKRQLQRHHFSLVEVGHVLLDLYSQRELGNVLCFSYNLTRFSRHVEKAPKSKEIGNWSFKNPFRKFRQKITASGAVN